MVQINPMARFLLAAALVLSLATPSAAFQVKDYDALKAERGDELRAYLRGVYNGFLEVNGVLKNYRRQEALFCPPQIPITDEFLVQLFEGEVRRMKANRLSNIGQMRLDRVMLLGLMYRYPCHPL